MNSCNISLFELCNVFRYLSIKVVLRNFQKCQFVGHIVLPLLISIVQCPGSAPPQLDLAEGPYSASPDLLAGFMGPKGREGKAEGKGWGKERKGKKRERRSNRALPPNCTSNDATLGVDSSPSVQQRRRRV